MASLVLGIAACSKLHASLPDPDSLPSQSRSASEQLRDLLLRLSDHWQSYCIFRSELAIPWTNHATESAMGRMKMRARTVRGYKSCNGMEAGLLLAGRYAG